MLDDDTLPTYQLTRTHAVLRRRLVSSSDSAARLRLRRATPRTAAAPPAPATWTRRPSDMARGGPVVEQDSIGPYDYAVLKADDETAMLQWLADNRYFVPAGTDDAVGPYIHPGAYFLALKLRGGETAGDIAPIVLALRLRPADDPDYADAGRRRRQHGHPGVGRSARRARFRATTITSSSTICRSGSRASRTYNQSAHQRRARGAGQARLHHPVRRPGSLVQGQLDYPGRFGDLDAAARADDASPTICTTCSRHSYRFDALCSRSCRATSPSRRRSSTRGVPLLQFYQYYDNYVAVRAGTDADGGADAPFDPGAAHRRDRHAHRDAVARRQRAVRRAIRT